MRAEMTNSPTENKVNVKVSQIRNVLFSALILILVSSIIYFLVYNLNYLLFQLTVLRLLGEIK